MKKLGLIVTYKNEAGEAFFFMPNLTTEDTANKNLNLNALNPTYVNLLFTQAIEVNHLDLGTITKNQSINVGLASFQFSALNATNLQESLAILDISEVDTKAIQNKIIVPKSLKQIQASTSSHAPVNNTLSAVPIPASISTSIPTTVEAPIPNQVETLPSKSTQIATDVLNTPPTSTTLKAPKPNQTETVPLKSTQIATDSITDILNTTAHSLLVDSLRMQANQISLTKSELLAWIKEPNLYALAGDEYPKGDQFKDLATWIQQQDAIELAKKLQQLQDSFDSKLVKIKAQYHNFLTYVVAKRIAYIETSLKTEKHSLQQNFKDAADTTIGYTVFNPTEEPLDAHFRQTVELSTAHHLLLEVKTLTKQETPHLIEIINILGHLNPNFKGKTDWLTWKRTDILTKVTEPKTCSVIRFNSASETDFTKIAQKGTAVTTAEIFLNTEYQKYLTAYQQAKQSGVTQLYLNADPKLNAKVSLSLQALAAINAGYILFDKPKNINVHLVGSELTTQQVKTFVDELQYYKLDPSKVEPASTAAPLFIKEFARWLVGEKPVFQHFINMGSDSMTKSFGLRSNWRVLDNSITKPIVLDNQNRAKTQQMVFLLLRSKTSGLTKTQQGQLVNYLKELAKYNSELKRVFDNFDKKQMTQSVYMDKLVNTFAEKFNQPSTNIIANTIFEYLHSSPQIAIETGNLELLQFLCLAGIYDFKDLTKPLVDIMNLCVQQLKVNPHDWRIADWMRAYGLPFAYETNQKDAEALLTVLIKGAVASGYSDEYIVRVKDFINFFYQKDDHLKTYFDSLIDHICKNTTDGINLLRCLLASPASEPAAIQSVIHLIRRNNPNSIGSSFNEIINGMAKGELNCAFLREIIKFYSSKTDAQETAKLFTALIEKNTTNQVFLREFFSLMKDQNIDSNNSKTSVSKFESDSESDSESTSESEESSESEDSNSNSSTSSADSRSESELESESEISETEIKPNYREIPVSIVLRKYQLLHQKNPKLNSRIQTATWISRLLSNESIDDSFYELLLGSLQRHDKSSALYQELLDYIEQKQQLKAEQGIDLAESFPAPKLLKAPKAKESFLSNCIKKAMESQIPSHKLALKLLAKAHRLESSLAYKYTTDKKNSIGLEINILHRSVELLLLQDKQFIPNNDAMLETAARNVIRKAAELLPNEEKTGLLAGLEIPVCNDNATTLWMKSFSEKTQTHFFKPIEENPKFTFKHSRLCTEQWLNVIAKNTANPEMIEIYYYAYATLYQQDKNSKLLHSVKNNLVLALGLDPTRPHTFAEISQQTKNQGYRHDPMTHREQLIMQLFAELHLKESKNSYKLIKIGVWNPDLLKKATYSSEIDGLHSAILAVANNKPIEKVYITAADIIKNVLKKSNVQLITPDAAKPATWMITDKNNTTCPFSTWSHLSHTTTTIPNLVKTTTIPTLVK